MPVANELDPSVERAIVASESAYPAYMAVVLGREFRAFSNALRILLNLDCDELLAAGVIDEDIEYRRFADDPFRFFTRASDRKAAALWTLIQRWQPESLRAPVTAAAA